MISNEIKDNIEILFNESLKGSIIARKLNLDRRTVCNFLKKKGYKFSKYGKIDVNSDIFNDINTEEKAYWLGFIYADGCIMDNNSFELSLQLRDKPHLEKFKNFLSYKGEIKIDSFRCRLSLRDTKIAEDLRKLGCIERKSLILKYPIVSQVPKNLECHFIRGYFDGDGYIRKKGSIEVSLLGTEYFLNKLLEYFNLYKKPIKDKRSSVFSISLTGDSARLFCKTIYENNHIKLERKYETYKSQIEKYEYKGD